MKGSFNDRVRQALERCFKVEEIFTSVQAREAAGLASLEHSRLYSALRDLSKYGEVENLGQGRWRRLGRETRPELREIMWRLLCIHRVMTAEDMALQSGASPKTVHEFFETQMRLKLVVNEEKRGGKPGRYRLIKDLGPEPPRDGAKAEKLRKIRAQKKQEALDKIDIAWRALGEARLAVSQMEEG